jgi:glycosyltransferase involved in cell wall biosynthesis
MTALATTAAALALLAWVRLALLGVSGRRAMLRLAPVAAGDVPTVTAVVPCRNEAAGVERAMRSLLAQERVALRVVAVDDRSTDATGAILARLAGEDARLDVLRVEALPDGWLGKNHACHVGVLRARSEWLLFTDADVVFAPEALRRAVDAARVHRLGHLAVPPRFVAPGLLERAFVTAFAALLAPFIRIADLRRPGTRAYFGVGAFNLVRRDAYERAGGHRRLPLEVVDDLKLGLLLRRSGVAQGVARADDLVSVRWQHGFMPSVLGLVKNAFAALEYRPWVALAGAVGAAFAGAVPPAVLVLGPTASARALAALALAVAVAHHAASARQVAGARGGVGLLMPACTVLLAMVVLASAAAAWARRGVVWRGTHYPLERVRAGCLREQDLPATGAAGWPDP